MTKQLSLIQKASLEAAKGPLRWIGRDGQTCTKCNCSFAWVNQAGVLQCWQCVPPKVESDVAVILILAQNDEVSSDYLGVWEEHIPKMGLHWREGMLRRHFDNLPTPAAKA